MKIDITHVTALLYGLLKRNAPVRGNPFPPSIRTRRQRMNYMKERGGMYPGNLKNNGIRYEFDRTGSSHIEIGGDPAPYAEYTETRSMKRGWMAKSHNELVDKLRQAGGRVR